MQDQPFATILPEKFEPARPDKERDLEAELFEGKSPEKILEQFETHMGYKQATPGASYQTVTRNILLQPSAPEDAETLNKLMNDPIYEILKWSENWDRDGDIRIFIIYTKRTDEQKKGS